MIQRLANVIYWVFSGIALIVLVLPVVLWNAGNISPQNVSFVFTVWPIMALGFYLFGRACRYILAGR